ncbi:type III secretion system effector XopF2 [Paracidovorax valerianellae]|uniref:Uncharacterized protein n=1 Tax=Paracidovorax valerianellae TaxID=187868 RepID=A0A1G7B234_9BURK|nr:type III secretion system effector XopF2 [Paracidovorax valerianellae]MDA8445687.1 hypothetical protein [Paracidovorax valerianellae]SDE21002.1 hypothetical protein SAMN05192589_113144 [Paracidovorax valerianellae]
MEPLNTTRARNAQAVPPRTGANEVSPTPSADTARSQRLAHDRLNARGLPVSTESGPLRRVPLPERESTSQAAGSTSRSAGDVVINMPSSDDGTGHDAAPPQGWLSAIGQTVQSGGRFVAHSVGAALSTAQTVAGQVVWSRQAPATETTEALETTEPVQDVAIELAHLDAAVANDAIGSHPPLPQTAGGRVMAALDDMLLQSDTPEQRELATTYRQWAAEKADAQEAAGVGSYSIRIGDAALPAAYDFVRQTLSSMSRSPATNAMATAIGPRSGLNAAGQSVNVGELSNQYDPALAGGTIGGLTAHMVDTTLLSAMDRRAAEANFPRFKAIDPKILVPDPCPVQLRVVDGKKVFWKPVTAGALDGNLGQPTMNELKAQVALRRKSVASLQAALDGKQWGVLAQPLVTAGFNVLRRHVMPIHAFTNPAQVFGHSLWASGLGGGVTKLTLGLGKSVAYTQVDDLAGGTQKHKTNVFARSLPHPEMPAASLSDISGLGSYGLEVVKEALDLTQHFWTGPWRTSGSLLPNFDDVSARLSDLGRTIASNVMASVGSTGIGALVGQLGRGGSNSALAGESLRSLGYMLQQAGQSSSNDFVWQATKEYLGGTSHDLSDSLDASRANKHVRLQNEALHLQAAAAAGAARLRDEALSVSSDEALYLSTAFDVLAGLQSREKPAVGDLEIAQKLLHAGVAGAGSEQASIAQVQALVDKAVRVLGQDAHLESWTKLKTE